jgi:hypothetical protein
MFEHNCSIGNRDSTLQPFQRFPQVVAHPGTDVKATNVELNSHEFRAVEINHLSVVVVSVWKRQQAAQETNQ